MKPVKKGHAPRKYSDYRAAKPDLIQQLGQHCSYCEAYSEPTGIDVEHIYPKSAHPRRKNDWDNLLLACTSCNSKKNSYLGSGRQRGLAQRFLWPHLDNTARAFTYFSDGSVIPDKQLSPKVKRMAENTMDMVGTMSNPAKAKDYKRRAIPYSAASIRESVWQEALSIKVDYLQTPIPTRAQLFARLAVKIGHFSIWIQVFSDRPEFRVELISAFSADPACFDNLAQPIPRGRV